MPLDYRGVLQYSLGMDTAHRIGHAMETISYEDASQPQQAAFRGSLWQAKTIARHAFTSPDRKAACIAKLRRLAAGQAVGLVVPSPPLARRGAEGIGRTGRQVS